MITTRSPVAKDTILAKRSLKTETGSFVISVKLFSFFVMNITGMKRSMEQVVVAIVTNDISVDSNDSFIN